jgi:hypothetical protein
MAIPSATDNGCQKAQTLAYDGRGLLPEGPRPWPAVVHINQLEARIKAEHPSVGWCFIEPDNKD